jgi:hypothetical protein
MKVKISFAGSFQCRLATDTDDSDASPNEPAPEGSPQKTLGKGWTFAWYEPPAVAGKPSLDRIIRLSNPYLLRNAMVDPWEDTKVTMVEASRSLVPGLFPLPGILADNLYVPVKADPLVGQVVSLGEAKFATRHPNSPSDGHEHLEDFAFSIGGMLFTASQVGKTEGAGVTEVGARDDVQTKYMQKKRNLVEALSIRGGPQMHPDRLKHLTFYSKGDDKAKGDFPMKIWTYASFYNAQVTTPNIPLTQVQILATTGLLARVQAENLTWKLTLHWSRFDGDTLTGQVDGFLEGSK